MDVDRIADQLRSDGFVAVEHALQAGLESPLTRAGPVVASSAAMRRERLALATFAIAAGVAVGCGASTSSTSDGGHGGNGGGYDGSGDSRADASSDGQSDAHPPGFCNTADDCVYKLTQPCCGFCVNVDDPPLPVTCPTGAICVAPPGGCSCVDHQCLDGTLRGGDSCDPQHDMCGIGYKCCQACGVAPTDGGPICPATCVLVMFSSTTGQYLCPLVP